MDVVQHESVFLEAVDATASNIQGFPARIIRSVSNKNITAACFKGALETPSSCPKISTI